MFKVLQSNIFALLLPWKNELEQATSRSFAIVAELTVNQMWRIQ